MSRLTSGQKIGVFAMQHGPGAENAFGGVAQAYGESVPILVLPMGYPRRIAHVQPNFNSVLNMRHVTKSAEQVTAGAEVPNVMRRAFTRPQDRPRRAGAGRGADRRVRRGGAGAARLHARDPAPDRARPGGGARGRRSACVAAKRPVIYAGQGVHYAAAWDELSALAELLAPRSRTSLGGKSAFPENHPLALGSGGNAIPAPVHHFLENADLIFGIGCSFTKTDFGVDMPAGKRSSTPPSTRSTSTRTSVCEHGADRRRQADARRRCSAELEPVVRDQRDPAPVADEIKAVREPWLAQWRPKLDLRRGAAQPLPRARRARAHGRPRPTPSSPTTPAARATSSRRSGSRPRRSPTSAGARPRSSATASASPWAPSWSHPDKLCINVWGDAAIGFTGMDFETAVRERIPILSILLNNFSMAIELPIMQVSTEKYRATDISGDYAAMARAFGGYGERVTEPDRDRPRDPARHRATERGEPALLEFITSKEIAVSKFK